MAIRSLSSSTTTRWKGTVDFYDRKKGWGFILPDDPAACSGNSDIFVHRGSIPSSKPVTTEGKSLHFLMKGDVVTFEVQLREQKKPTAMNVTFANGKPIPQNRFDFLQENAAFLGHKVLRIMESTNENDTDEVKFGNIREAYLKSIKFIEKMRRRELARIPDANGKNPSTKEESSTETKKFVADEPLTSAAAETVDALDVAASRNGEGLDTAFDNSLNENNDERSKTSKVKMKTDEDLDSEFSRLFDESDEPSKLSHDKLDFATSLERSWQEKEQDELDDHFGKVFDDVSSSVVGNENVETSASPGADASETPRSLGPGDEEEFSTGSSEEETEEDDDSSSGSSSSSSSEEEYDDNEESDSDTDFDSELKSPMGHDREITFLDTFCSEPEKVDYGTDIYNDEKEKDEGDLRESDPEAFAKAMEEVDRDFAFYEKEFEKKKKMIRLDHQISHQIDLKLKTQMRIFSRMIDSGLRKVMSAY